MSIPSRNIYIVGAQSVGKTTLVNALARYFEEVAIEQAKPLLQPRLVKEVARGVLRRHNFSADDIVSSKSRALELQRLILEAQAEAEKAAGDEGWYISDRSGIDPLVYARRYAGEGKLSGLMQSHAWRYLEPNMRTGLVVVCEAGGEWLLDDGVRLMPEDRAAWLEVHEEFCRILSEVKIDFQVLPASLRELDARVQFVVRRWQEGQHTSTQVEAG